LPRIRLAFDQRGLWVTGQIYSPNLAKPATVKFLVDTGASATILSLRDAEMAGLDVNSLPRSPQRAGGYGGKIELRLMSHAMLVFASDASSPKCVELPSLSVQFSSMESKRSERMLYSIPTVVGTDVLQAGEFSLWVDWPMRQAHLDYF
jgi:hypothetical protein